MRIERNELVARVVLENLKNTKVGILVNDVPGVSPAIVVGWIAGHVEQVYAVAAGYGSFDVGQYDNVVSSMDIETAVSWRNKPYVAGHVVVFVKGDMPKTHSLAEFDVLGSRDVAAKLIDEARAALAQNLPEQSFWDALAQEAATIPLPLLEDFVQAVADDGPTGESISSNLWRLGLLADSLLIQARSDAAERLSRNRELVMEMGHLSEASRRRIGMVLSKSKGQKQHDLREAFRALKEYYLRGQREVLARLEVSVVEELLKAGKPMPKSPPAPGADADGSLQPPPVHPVSVLKGRELKRAIAELVVSGTEGASRGLRQLGELMRERLAQTEPSSEAVTLEDGFGSLLVLPDIGQADLRRFIGHLCTERFWGGRATTTKSEVREALRRASPEETEGFDPESPEDGILGRSLFGLLRAFDRFLPPEEHLAGTINRLVDSRRALLRHVDLLLADPLVLFGGYRETREALERYLDAYSELLSSFRKNEALLHQRDQDATRWVASGLLLLDVIRLQTPTEWKAILTPLHPIHLWRYREILSAVTDTQNEVDEESKAKLATALADLPHLLHFVVFNAGEEGQAVVLPQAGTVLTLPIYENHTNRYLGTDGISFLGELLPRWARFEPFSRVQIRVGVVDPPDLALVIRTVTDFIKASKNTRVVLDAYFTRGQNWAVDLVQLAFDEHDQDIAELLQSERLLLRAIACASIEDVVQKLESRPVHIAYLFDQSQYRMSHAPRAHGLLVSPLVVTYQYDYSELFGRGTIAPSSEAQDGMFADFHFLVERAAQLPAGQQLRLTYGADAGLAPVNEMLRRGVTRWLAIADRSLSSYAPEGAVPLGEVRVGQREIAVWASSGSRTIGEVIEALREYSLRPTAEMVADLLREYGHIGSAGLMGLPPVGARRDSRQTRLKGMIGTVLVAAWYRQRYPRSLIASLDSAAARQWLSGREEGNQRADLVGLRLEHDQLIVEPIEVKTHAEGAEVVISRDSETGQWQLSGRAVQQVSATLRILEEVFGLRNGQPLFTPARREVLKYQLHRECFRDLHDASWQKEWYRILQAAFAHPQPQIPVRLRGLITHVHLEGGSREQSETVEDLRQNISVVTLGSTEFQDLVGQPGDVHHQGTVYAKMHLGQDSVAAESEASMAVDVGTPAGEAETTAPTVQHLVRPQGAEIKTAVGEYNDVDLEELARLFRRSALSFRVTVEECDARSAVLGPTVCRFYIRLGRGQRLDQLKGVLDDIGREMRRSGLLVTPVPNSDYVALDIPRNHRQTLSLERGLKKLPRVETPEQLPIAIGVSPEGADIIRDMGSMPHLLVGGTTGSGKTIFLYGLLASLLVTHPEPNTLRLLISTSKPEDFVFFSGLSHLETGSVVDDAEQALRLLENEVKDAFEQRLARLTGARCRDIRAYNAKSKEKIPPLVVVVDEFADLADQLAGNKTRREAFYTNLRRIAQLGRNRGIHLVLSTQRPSADLVPTHIRNLMNARVSLRVNDATASRMILEEAGAENLQMHGDLLFKEQGTLTRAQGYFIDGEGLDTLLGPLR